MNNKIELKMVEYSLELKYGVVYYIKNAMTRYNGPIRVKLVGPPPELFNKIINFTEYHGEQQYLMGKFIYECSKDAPELKVGDKYKINDEIYELGEGRNKPSDEYHYNFKLISSVASKNSSSGGNNEQDKIIQKLKEELSTQKENFQKQLTLKTKELQELQQKIRNTELKLELEMNKKHSSNSFHPKPQNSNEFQIFDSNDLSKFDKIEEIGFGDGGKVFKVAQKTFYALKEMNIKNINTKNFRNFIREYELMSMLDHPNILKAYGFFFSDNKIPPSILLEYIPCNLNDAIINKTLRKPQIVFVIYQIAEGLKYIHFRKIIHCDVKPSNILINSNGIVKISDFGIAKLMTNDGFTISNGLGTQRFMAPEILN